MIEVRPYQEGDLNGIEFKTVYLDGLPVGGEHFFVSPFALTFVADGCNLAVIDGIFLTRGVFYIWGLISEKVRKYPVGFHRAAKKNLEKWIKTHKIHRIQMAVKSDYDEGRRWARSLGFHSEGLMKKFGPDKSDHWLYARLT